MGDIIEAGSNDFDSIIKSNSLTLVDFWAPWCGPCKMQNPILQKIAESDDVSVSIVKVNTDDNPDIAQKYGIASIPTLILFKDGQEIDRFVGVQPEAVLKEKLQKS